MPVDVSTGIPTDAAPLFQLIRRTRYLLRSSWVLTGVGLTAGFLLSTLAAVALLDLLLPLGVVLRCLALLLVVVPAGWALLAGVLWPLVRRLKTGQVARRIESHLPGIHNRLVSCVDLARNRGSFQQSPAFYRRLLHEAIERIRNFRPSRVVDFPTLRRAGVFAAAGLLALMLVWSIFTDRLPTTLARIFLPFADIPPASGVLYAVAPGDAKVLHGEDVAFTVRVDKGEPEKLWLELRGDRGKPLHYDLVRDKQDAALWKLTLNSSSLGAGFEQAFRYRVHGGGTWSPQYQITLVERPTIVSYHTILHYPEYLGISEVREGPPQTLDVTGPEGSQVEVVVQAEGSVAEAEIQMLDYRSAAPASGERQPSGSAERLWFDEKLPAGATTDGTWQWDSDTHHKATHTEPPALGTHGHWFHGAADGFTLHPHECLFTDGYIVPGHEPETIMLEWHDGADWEHRAYWGKDTIRLGKPESRGRRRLGDLPPAGQWWRLQVPAELVGLEGKTVRGMSFKLSGGQCYWHAAGALPPTLGVVRAIPMQQLDDSRWSGRFPLHGTGLYRVELRNELGHANKPMKEGRYIATPDLPPQIVLERPGSDVTLSEPAKVPLVLAAFDDFGLADIALTIHRSDTGKSERRIIKQYAKPQRSDSVATSIDLAALKLPMNGYIRYRLEASDRKGQTAQTQEYMIRLAADPNAADKQLAAFDKSQDPFGERLANLIAEQAKVQQAMEKLAVKYAPLIEQVEAARADLRPAPEGSPQAPAPAKMPEPLKLDPKLADLLKPLQQELAQVAAQEEKNVQLAQQLSGELAKSAEDAGKMPLMPRNVAEQMSQLERLFQQSALQPMQNLATRLQQGADPKNAPEMKTMQSLSSRLQKELESLQSRLRALAKARRNMRGDIDDALARLRRDLLRENTSLTARELEELREHIAKLREELKRLGVSQEQLLQKKGAEDDVRAMEKKQNDLGKQLARLLAEAKNLLGDEKTRRMKRPPDFPNAPYDPDTKEKRVPPKEEDTDEGEPTKKAKDKSAKSDPKAAKGKKDDDEEEPLFMPGLGGPKPKLDPRFAKKLRPTKPKTAKKDGDSASDSRNERQSREEQALQELDMAQQALGSDEQSLSRMLEQLQQAASRSASRSGQRSGQSSESDGDMDSELAEQLAELLNSPSLQRALAMAARMRQSRSRGQAPAGQTASGQPAPSHSPTGNLTGGERTGDHLNAELAKLDPQTRTVILRMQPKLREELLQGMREAGPEGYQKFIDDYFKRLAEVKK